MHDLATSTMTVLGLQRLFSTNLIGDLTTLAFGLPFHRTKLLRGLNQIWRTSFPFLTLHGALRRRTGDIGFGD